MQKIEAYKIYLFALGVFLIDASLVYVNQAGLLLLNKVLFSQFVVSVIFGFFHAYKTFLFVQTRRPETDMGDLLYLFAIYTAWYNVVLLPLSGFGILEWTLVLLVLGADFLCSVTGKTAERYVGSSGWSLVVFGVILFLVKIVLFYLFPNNLYLASFVGNATARTMVLIFSVAGLFFLLSCMMRLFKSHRGISVKKTAGTQKIKEIKEIKEIIKMLVSLVLRLFAFVLSLLSDPVFIIAVLVLGFGSLVAIFAFAKGIADDILRFVEPLLKKATETGKNAFTPSILYDFFQVLVVIGVLFFTVAYAHWLEKQQQQAQQSPAASPVQGKRQKLLSAHLKALDAEQQKPQVNDMVRAYKNEETKA